MLGTFIDKLSGFFGLRFIIAFWSPSCICLGIIMGLVGVVLGPTVVFSWWSHLDVTEQVLLAGVILLAITLLGYLLEAISVPLTNVFAGYWPQILLTLHMRIAQIHPTEKKKQNAKYASAVRSHIFPHDPDLLKPTRLGNVLAAVDEYSFALYRLDAFIWWPRLSPLLPESFRTQVDTSLTPMQAMLNLSMFFCLLAIGGGTTMLIDHRWALFLIVGFSGLMLAWICYLAAVNQAINYGVLVRVAFDFYRHEILKQMHIPVPDNLVEERLLWNRLNSVVDEYIMPWEDTKDEDTSETRLSQLANPFYYDTHQSSVHILKRGRES